MHVTVARSSSISRGRQPGGVGLREARPSLHGARLPLLLTRLSGSPPRSGRGCLRTVPRGRGGYGRPPPTFFSRSYTPCPLAWGSGPRAVGANPVGKEDLAQVWVIGSQHVSAQRELPSGHSVGSRRRTMPYRVVSARDGCEQSTVDGLSQKLSSIEALQAAVLNCPLPRGLVGNADFLRVDH